MTDGEFRTAIEIERLIVAKATEAYKRPRQSREKKVQIAMLRRMAVWRQAILETQLREMTDDRPG